MPLWFWSITISPHKKSHPTTPFLTYPESKRVYKYSAWGLAEVETRSLLSLPIPCLPVVQVFEIHPVAAMATVNKSIALPGGSAIPCERVITLLA
jgi:hypothetical protein